MKEVTGLGLGGERSWCVEGEGRYGGRRGAEEVYLGDGGDGAVREAGGGGRCATLEALLQVSGPGFSLLPG